jgi:hypothetical protein
MFLAIYLPVIRSEEAFLGKKFPEFEDYARRVPRMLPRITPACRRESAGGFSTDLYLTHREYNALLGSLGMVAGLVVKMVLTRTTG